MAESELEAKTIETYDRTAHIWSVDHATRNDWKGEAERLKQWLPAGSILEIGCGGGRDAKELMRLGYDYYGTDASRSMVQSARTAVRGAAFEVRNVYDLTGLGKRFDGFWACAVLLHIPRARIDEALTAIRSALRAKAVGMISIKDGDKDDFEVRDKNGVHEERLFVYWRKPDFEAVLARNGFTVLDYTYRPVSQRTNWHIYFVQKQDKN